jgi:hypothetical protein
MLLLVHQVVLLCPQPLPMLSTALLLLELSPLLSQPLLPQLPVASILLVLLLALVLVLLLLLLLSLFVLWLLLQPTLWAMRALQPAATLLCLCCNIEQSSQRLLLWPLQLHEPPRVHAVVLLLQ